MPENDDLTRRMQALADRLLERTRNEEIRWRATDNDRAFLFVGSDASVLVGRVRDGIQVAIQNANGAEVESLTSMVWDPMLSDQVEADWSDLFVNLYEAARRNALNVDKSIDSLLKDLEDPAQIRPRTVYPEDEPF